MEKEWKRGDADSLDATFGSVESMNAFRMQHTGMWSVEMIGRELVRGHGAGVTFTQALQSALEDLAFNRADAAMTRTLGR